MIQAIYIISSLLLLVSQVWLIILAYRRSGLMWAVLVAFFSLIAGLVFCIVKKEGWLPWGLNVLAWLGAISIYLHWI